MRRQSWLGLALALLLAVCVAVLPGCSAELDLSGFEDVVPEEAALEEGEQEEAVPEEEAGPEEEVDPAAESEEAAPEEAAPQEASPEAQPEQAAPKPAEDEEPALDEDGTYTSKDEVAWYLHTYGHLPSNYITKDEAEDAGWKTQGLSLAEACPGMSIGGDRFGNREGKLPKASGRTWMECDIDYDGGRSRGPKRIVYSNDGLIYYTGDHYETFERLY